MPTVRRPTSLFQMKNPGANAWPSISAQPAGIDQEAEHVLLATIQSRAAGDGFLRWTEVRREFVDQVQQVGIVEPGVAGRMNRTNLSITQQQLQRLVAHRKRLVKEPLRRIRAEPIDGLLGDVGQTTELAKAPVVHQERSIAADS